MKYTLIFITGFLFFGQQLTGQSTRHHKIQYSASDLKLVEWNTEDTLNGNFVVEKIDSQGRTKELRFFNWNRQLDWPGSGFYGGPIIKYDYKDNEIIETYFSSDNEIANDFQNSEVQYKSIYTISNDEILDVKYIYKIDFELNPEDLQKKIDHLQFYLDFIKSEENNMERTEVDYEIFGYRFAQAKMNGINPKSK